MLTKQQKAETKKYLSILSYIYEIFSIEKQHCFKTLSIQILWGKINYLPPVQHYWSFAWDKTVLEYQWMVITVKDKTKSIQ